MSDTLTKEQLQIQAAYGRVQKHVQKWYEYWMQDALDNPEDYEGIDSANAYIWFVESFL